MDKKPEICAACKKPITTKKCVGIVPPQLNITLFGEQPYSLCLKCAKARGIVGR